MDANSDKYELWGTFSVMDHLKPGAFIAEVVMYDHLVIPVPPDPKNAKTKDERIFAEKQRARWEEKWNPSRQQELLKIIEPVATPIEWTMDRHKMWAAEYEKSKLEAANQVSDILAGWKTGEQLLGVVPAMARGAVAVSPYDSLEALKRDFGITEISRPEEQLMTGRGLPGNLVSAVVGREFLVPDDPDRDEFDLLREAVSMVQEDDYRKARSDFHTAQQRFIDNGVTDFVSIKAAVEEMADHLNTMEQMTRKRRIWNGLRRAFYFVGLAYDLITAPINPVAAGKAAISLGKFTIDERLKDTPKWNDVRRGGALLLDAQRRLNLEMKPIEKP